ncbi:MAG: hypothetical protein AAGC92_14895 [Pseudomonadota bacterium]
MNRLFCILKSFLKSESGTVTVDWVVLTALVVGLAGPLGINYVAKLTSASAVVADGIRDRTAFLSPLSN